MKASECGPTVSVSALPDVDTLCEAHSACPAAVLPAALQASGCLRETEAGSLRQADWEGGCEPSAGLCVWPGRTQRHWHSREGSCTSRCGDVPGHAPAGAGPAG